MESINSVVLKTVYISAKNNTGYDELANTVSQLYDLGKIDLSEDAIISNARQFSAVSLSLDSAVGSRDALLMGQTPDIVLFSLEKALSDLDMIDGREATEEIVNTIFSKFCVGK